MPTEIRRTPFASFGLSPQPLSTEPQAIWEDSSLKKGAQVSILLVTILLLGAWYVVGKVPPEIPLQYSRPWGREQLVPKSALWFITLGGTLVAVVHFVLASLVFEKDKLSARLVIWAGVFLLFFLLLSVLTVYVRVGPQT